jgi:F0F1-type ATP synthase assembly protein I
MLSLMSSVQAVLCVLVTVIPFLSRMSHAQIFLVALIEIIGYSLNFAVELLGINVVTCGGGMTIFLFAATFAYFIKLFNFPFQRHVPDSNYSNGTLKLIGVILMVFSWPGFNVMGTLFDVGNVSSTANLAPSAYFNTILCLSSSIICSITVQSFGNRINMHKFSESVFNVKNKLK